MKQTAVTYGSEGSDSTLKSSLNSTLNQSSQTEISDEEILNEAEKYYDNNGTDVIFAMGAKWMRERLKQRQ